MTDFPKREQSPAGAGAAALLLGVAIGAAALLLSTPQGKSFLEQFTQRSEEWKAAAAAALAERREQVVSSVEGREPNEQEGRLREQL